MGVKDPHAAGTGRTVIYGYSFLSDSAFSRRMAVHPLILNFHYYYACRHKKSRKNRLFFMLSSHDQPFMAFFRDRLKDVILHCYWVYFHPKALSPIFRQVCFRSFVVCCFRCQVCSLLPVTAPVFR